MLTKVLIGLSTLVALVHGIVPDVVPENILPLALVVIGLIYGAMCLDAEDATGYMVFAVAVGAAGMGDVLTNIHVVGGYLDAILDAKVIVLLSAVASILVVRSWNRLTGDDSGGEESA